MLTELSSKATTFIVTSATSVLVIFSATNSKTSASRVKRLRRLLTTRQKPTTVTRIKSIPTGQAHEGEPKKPLTKTVVNKPGIKPPIMAGAIPRRNLSLQLVNSNQPRQNTQRVAPPQSTLRPAATQSQVPQTKIPMPSWADDDNIMDTTIPSQDDQGEWIFPKKSKTGPKSPDKPPTKPTATGNRFGLLQIQNLPEDPPSQSQSQPTQTSSKRKWIPPITVTTPVKDYNRFVNDIRTTLEHENFEVQFNIKSTKIFLRSDDDFTKITYEFESNNVQFFTLTRSQDKVKKVVLKAPPGWQDDQIIKNLTDKGKKVKNVIPLKSKTGTSHSYLVTLPFDQKINEIKEIKSIENCKVKWEHYAKKRNYTQCFRCQEFGHAQFNCRNNPKCVKCPGLHHYKDCKIQRGDNTVPFCHNCKGAHAANYSKCPALQSYLEKRNLANNKPNQQNQQRNTPNFNINYNTNFPKSYRGPGSNPTYATPTHSSYKDKLLNINKGSNNDEITEIIKYVKIIKSLKEDIQNCQTEYDKIEVVLRYIEHF